MVDVKKIAMNLDVCMDDNIAAFWTAKKKNTLIDPKTEFNLIWECQEGNQKFV